MRARFRSNRSEQTGRHGTPGVGCRASSTETNETVPERDSSTPLSARRPLCSLVISLLSNCTFTLVSLLASLHHCLILLLFTLYLLFSTFSTSRTLVLVHLYLYDILFEFLFTLETECHLEQRTIKFYSGNAHRNWLFIYSFPWPFELSSSTRQLQRKPALTLSLNHDRLLWFSLTTLARRLLVSRWFSATFLSFSSSFSTGPKMSYTHVTLPRCTRLSTYSGNVHLDSSLSSRLVGVLENATSLSPDLQRKPALTHSYTRTVRSLLVVPRPSTVAFPDSTRLLIVGYRSAESTEDSLLARRVAVE
ncbi:hypothetical protein SAMN04487950_0860 [Halogranum rubrum]|uniref:Transmembrane protein n=1 Tax=Halogranum rubrum TaxID=553466 RepID=A0A1I4BZ12_9EURY|nr:hypothetical protein SAMN04487950_0860 [Halogranum rubrum]